MAAIVIDASATLGWLFDEGSAASKIKPVLDRSELISPWLWRLEVVNAVLVQQRRKILSQPQATRLLRLLDELSIDLVPEPATRTATSLADFARPYQLTSYDAEYLDLAVRLGLPLLSRDGNLLAAAKRLGVQAIIP
jgi:predicted nucleic acid-binding protein